MYMAAIALWFLWSRGNEKEKVEDIEMKCSSIDSYIPITFAPMQIKIKMNETLAFKTTTKFNERTTNTKYGMLWSVCERVWPCHIWVSIIYWE